MSPTLTGPQKAAMVLAQMGTERASQVLRSMSESEVVALMAEMAQLPPLDKDVAHKVLIEFAETVAAQEAAGRVGIEAARKLLHERLGATRAEEVLGQLSANHSSAPLVFLNGIEPLQVANFLGDEHAQTIAVVLANLPYDHAAAVMRNLGEEQRVEVAQRIATTGRVSPEVIQQIADVLEHKLSMLVPGSTDSLTTGGVPALVGILNNTERAAEKQILADLEAIDPALAEEVRNQLFVFDDVVNLDDRTLQRVLRNVVPKDLAVALKGVDDAVRDKFLRNLSERAALDLVEEIDVLGPTRLSAVESAQAQVVKTVRNMEAAGEIMLSRGEDDLLV